MTEWAEFVDFMCLTIHKLLCWCSVLKYTWVQQIQLIRYFYLFLILFWCSFQSFGTPWLYKFSFYFCKSISVCSSPFRSLFCKLWHQFANELTTSEKLLHTTNVHCQGADFKAKQGRPLCHCRVQYIQPTYSRPLYSVQICRIDIILKFDTKYITDFLISACIHLPILTFTMN